MPPFRNVVIAMWFFIYFCDNHQKVRPLNPSGTKPFGIHTLYRVGGGGVGLTKKLKNRCLHEHESLYVIRDILEHPRNVQVSYIVINWLP